MPRFVILEHDHPTQHWDFMLEAGDALRTWRLEAPPSHDHAVSAVPSFDHRLAYLGYEGPVSDGRGQVRRWDAGSFTWLTDTPQALTIQIHGTRCRGIVAISADQLTFRPES